MSLYPSSLYGPVYLVSHIVTVYLMPELGLIVALEPREESGFQTAVHPEFSSGDNNSACYPVFFLPMNMTATHLLYVKN